MSNKSYEKPIRKLLFLISLLIISPIILTLAFKAQKIYVNFPEVTVFYVLITIGICLILFTLFWGFKTFQSFLNILFNE